MGKRWVISLSLVVLLLSLMQSPEPSAAVFDVPSDLNVGPFVDKIVYKMIRYRDQRILALQAGEIDMDLGHIHPFHRPILETDPDIDIYEAVRNGYGQILINCAKYPLNISGFRRAFAYAFDKTRITSQIFDGYNIEHDSLVPRPNSWCIEDELDWHYYTNQSDIGNQILDNLNFTIDPGTGFRLAPNGSAFNIEFEYDYEGYYGEADATFYGRMIAEIGVDVLRSLHINSSDSASYYNDVDIKLQMHQDYDMIINTLDFGSNDVDWLAYEFWSEYADDPYQNPTNFRNTTFDSWRDQLLYGTTYEEMYEASAEMQKILHYNVPRLVVYVNTYMQGYRNDQFVSHVPDIGRYITGQWTTRKIHKLDDTRGGLVSIGFPNRRDPTFNIFNATSPYSLAILEEIWPSLYRHDPDLTAVPYLAEALTVETHANNTAVPIGHTRFTIDIIQNATWTDGTPLIGEDVAFSYTYAVESGIYGNPAAFDLSDLVTAYAPTRYRVVLEFSTESYWHFSNFAFDFVIPQHIFNNETGIGYTGWNTWNPVFDPTEPHVTSGPFFLSDFELGEYYELSVNTDFPYYPEFFPPSSSTTTEPGENPIGPINLAPVVIGGVSSAVIIVLASRIIPDRDVAKTNSVDHSVRLDQRVQP